jgi:hypothetical protein
VLGVLRSSHALSEIDQNDPGGSALHGFMKNQKTSSDIQLYGCLFFFICFSMSASLLEMNVHVTFFTLEKLAAQLLLYLWHAKIRPSPIWLSSVI